MRARAIAAHGALCVALCAASRRAAAAPLTASISVERDEQASDCPDAPELTGRVERILQRSLARSSAADEQLRVLVHFAWSREQYLAEVHSEGPKPGERSLYDRGPNCSALAEAVSVAIALLLDKELEQRAVEAAPALAPARTDHQPARNEPSASHSPLELRASLEGGLGSGLVGQTSPLLSEQVGVRIQRGLTLDAGFNAVLPGTTAYGEGQVRTTLLFGSARACYTWGTEFSLGPCAELGLGRLRGVGIGYAQVASQDLTWSALGAGVVAEGPVWGRVFAGLAANLWWPTRRSTFSVENVGTAWESRPLAGSLVLRLGFRIW